MDTHERFRQVVENRTKNEGAASRQRRLDESRRSLIRVLRKKLTTSFIGAIVQFEKSFGHLWGIGRDASACTENQLKWRSVWDACRNEVLNNGNHQVRAVESEVEQYDILWNRHQITLPVRQPQKEQGNG